MSSSRLDITSRSPWPPLPSEPECRSQPSIGTSRTSGARSLRSALILYRGTTAGVALANLDQLIEFLPTLYERFAGTEATTRWNLAAPQNEAVRPKAAERLPILRSALGPTLADLAPADADALLRGLLLLTSPTSLLYWQDYLDVSVQEAAETASWLIRRLATPAA